MPYSDAIAYFHGTGASAGLPVTQTPNALTGVSQSAYTLSYTLGADSRLVVGSVVTLAGGGYTTQNVVVTAILTGSGIVGAGTATVNVSQTVTTTTATAYPVTLGDTITVDAYSNLELDFGAPNSGVAYPWVVAFPSLTEKGYTFSPEPGIGAGGTEYGVHIEVLSPFVATATINFQVVTSAAIDPVVGTATNIIAQRQFTLAQLQVTGVHYFIPVPQAAVLEFLRIYFDVTTTATGGTVVCYWGPKNGGEQ